MKNIKKTKYELKKTTKIYRHKKRKNKIIN